MAPPKKRSSRRRTASKKVQAPKGRQVIPPQYPLSQYGEKVRSAYNAYVQRVAGSDNAITFQEFRSEWDTETGAAPSPAAPKSQDPEVIKQSLEDELPLLELEIKDPALVYAPRGSPKPRESKNANRLRPQRSFGIFPTTDQALRSVARQELIAAGDAGAKKNDLVEAALLLAMEDAQRDPVLHQRWIAKARQLRGISFRAIQEGYEKRG